MAPATAGPRPREVCEQCGFDSDLYSRADTISSPSIVPAVLKAAIEGLEDEVLQTRPDPTTWSIAEYFDHVRETAFGNRFVIEAALADPELDLGPLPIGGITDEVRRVDVEEVCEAVEAEFAALGRVLAGLSGTEWDIAIALGAERKPIGYFARHILHDGFHHLGDVGRIRQRLGFGAPTTTGVIHQINVSGGGVPKRPVDRSDITAAGVAGDAQDDRRHHGRPAQAVCLWSEDVIAELRAEGHPIAAGNAGENITIAGVDWEQLRPGTRIDVGAVPLLVSAHAIPCAKNAQWFADGDFTRILHGRHPGSSRLYAIVLAAGTVAAGDAVTVEP
ncbi:MAG: MOSC domain-containing protein [Acidimicrobiales bacterium]|nr:MOSC domain-containing protein [Acidimicrobiales bacterium]